MKMKRLTAVFLTLCMVFCLLPALTMNADAATVNYRYNGKYVYNWGTREETATFLSPMAEDFYEDNDITYEDLAALTGSATTSSVPNSALYKKLQTLMTSNHSYQTSYAATRDLYKYTDCQQNGLWMNGKISSFYSGDPIGPGWDSGKTWNREHTWPNSKGDASGNGENDIMMLRPTATSENGSRSNKAYGKSSGYYFPNKESGGTHDVRGDVARIMLFVYCRWGNTGKMWGSSGVIESKAVLLEWAEIDPVDTWELGRNDATEAITGTRNVFVDYPELIFVLFGAEIPDNMPTPSGKAMASGCSHKDYDVVAAAPATCTSTGHTAGYYCNDCDEYFGGYTVIAATGHSWKAATCTAPKTCTVCGTTEGNVGGHRWNAVGCTSAATCTVCGTSTGKPTGHTYTDGVDGTCNSCGIHREDTEKRTVKHMFRMYDPNSGEHFYTGSEVERQNLINAGWDYEGVGFTFSEATGAPVYRLYDPMFGEHLYTMDEEEKEFLVSQGWNLEGVAFNSAYDTEVPQYRLHNPNATRGAYHFTASEEERDNLIEAGWEDQGIGFYSAWK